MEQRSKTTKRTYRNQHNAADVARHQRESVLTRLTYTLSVDPLFVYYFWNHEFYYETNSGK